MTRFKGKPAIDPSTNMLVKDGSGQVFAVTDTAFASPLEVTDAAGLPLPTISTGSLGIHQDFDTVTEQFEVVWKSGPYTVTLESAEGIAAKAATDAAQAAAASVDTSAAVNAELAAHALKNTTPGLDKWFTSVANRDTLGRPLRILAQGDSITEGPYALEATVRWQTVVQGHLRRALGISGGAVWPWIPAYPGTPNATFPVVRTGTVSWSDYGLAWRGAIVGTDGQLTFTFTGTRCALHYLKASVTGALAVSIDGGAATVIDTNATTNPGSDLNAVWTSPVLTAGAHTVTVTRDPSSADGQNPYINGLATYDGDETEGLRIIDAARSGIASTFATAVRLTRQAAVLNDLGPFDLAVIALGTNDAIPGSETDPATYKANIERIITSYRSEAGHTGAILLVNMYKGEGRTEANYAPYGDQLAAIAAADPDVGFLDLRRHLPDVPTPTDAISGLGYFIDTLHPTEAGYRAMSGVITDALLPA